MERAKRLGEGEYLYRGFKIKDHGKGNSVDAAQQRYSGRWKIWRVTGPGYFDVEYVDSAHSLKEAKSVVDKKS